MSTTAKKKKKRLDGFVWFIARASIEYRVEMDNNDKTLQSCRRHTKKVMDLKHQQTVRRNACSTTEHRQHRQIGRKPIIFRTAAAAAAPLQQFHSLTLSLFTHHSTNEFDCTNQCAMIAMSENSHAAERSVFAISTQNAVEFKRNEKGKHSLSLTDFGLFLFSLFGVLSGNWCDANWHRYECVCASYS